MAEASSGQLTKQIVVEPNVLQWDGSFPKISRSLDGMVKAFHQARLSDDWVYLFLDGVSLRVRRPGGRKRVQMLVAYGVGGDGRRRLLGFQRSQGESQ